MTTFYQTYITDYMTIDMDEQGLFCSVPSEKDINVKYTVRCDEHKDSVDVVNCSCPGYRRYGHCKHFDACQAYWTKMYRSNQEKLAAKAAKAETEKKAAEAAKREQEAKKIVAQVPQFTNMFKKRWNKIEEAREQRENYREMLAQAREIRERREMAPLNGNRAFSLMR